MTTELRLLAWTLVLALIQIVIAAAAKRQQDTLEWAGGARDADPPRYTGLAGRLSRAQSNLFETLPLFAAAVLVAHVAGRNGTLTFWGAQLYFWARLVYVPLYASGVPMIRSVVWGVSVVGLVLLLIAIL